jgi:hypothetical protein
MRWNGIRSISVCLRTRRATRCNGRSSSLRGAGGGTWTDAAPDVDETSTKPSYAYQ